MDAQALKLDRRGKSWTEALITLTRRGPIHAMLLIIGVIWLVPSVGLAVTSFRTRGDISASGWWTVAGGERTVTDQPWELTVVEAGESGENTVFAGETASGNLLTDAVEGIPAAAISRVRIEQISGVIKVEAFGQPIALDGVGAVIIHADATHDFAPAAAYDGAFITEVDSAETPFSLEFQLQGFESIQGELEIEEIGEAERVPRAGKIIVNADGGYIFEPRASFVGSFEATIDRGAVANPPFTIQYAMERAGGPLETFDAGATIQLPLAGALHVSADGRFEFAAAADFAGVIEMELGVQNPLLTLENYVEVFTREQLAEPGFINFFKNSFIITVPSTLLTIVIAATAAYAFSWLDLPFRNIFYLLAIAMLIVPMQTTWIPVLRMLNAAGLIGTFPGIWIAHASYGTPFAIFLLYNFFRDLPGELFEAARVDGASEFGMFFRIVIPLSMPAIASLGIFQFVWIWNDLMNALIFLVDQQLFPLTVGIRQLVGKYANEWDILASGAFITMVVPLIVFFSLQRYFVRGVTAGAVKG
ncbi:MAG: carbohydrate ABC transporter permease [Chloroflexota bacterium]|nr:carbohydrate ABC transporter permease [Chloroflexota bacterium]MDE2947971.1 carbohydrate ABC transporter permease [Chloroflexota bacterium]